MNSKYLPLSIVLPFLFLAACTSAKSGAVTPAPQPSTSVEPQKPDAETPATQTPAPKAEPSKPVSENENCPWDLQQTDVFKKYAALQIKIDVDCSMAQSFFNLRRSDLDLTLKTLDESSDLFTNWQGRPEIIRIGQRTFHSSKDKIIQLPARTNSSIDVLKDFLIDVKTLMSFEAAQFDSQVRVSLFQYDLGRTKNGQIVDVGGGLMWSRGTAELTKDLELLKKYKPQILAHKNQFPNIVLFYGNQFGQFQIDAWNMNYSFTPEVAAAEQVAFFKYLTKYETVRAAYAPVDLVSRVNGYPEANFQAFEKMLDVAAKIKDAVISFQPQPKRLALNREVTPDFSHGLSLSYTNNTLSIERLMSYDDTVASADQLLNCLAHADFSKTSRYKCQDARGANENP